MAVDDRRHHRYAGVGSRETPTGVLRSMSALASTLEDRGLILRSGGAPGADQAFESGVSNPEAKEIYLPWRLFELNPSDRYKISQAAFDMAAKYHPAWYRLSEAARKLHARNCYQVLGEDLKTPSLFLVCWTRGGLGGGGTGQAIRIARAHDVPVFDLGLYSYRHVVGEISYILDGGRL